MPRAPPSGTSAPPSRGSAEAQRKLGLLLAKGGAGGCRSTPAKARTGCSRRRRRTTPTPRRCSTALAEVAMRSLFDSESAPPTRSSPRDATNDTDENHLVERPFNMPRAACSAVHSTLPDSTPTSGGAHGLSAGRRRSADRLARHHDLLLLFPSRPPTTPASRRLSTSATQIASFQPLTADQQAGREDDAFGSP